MSQVDKDSRRLFSARWPAVPVAAVLIASCMSITEPPKGGNVLNPVVAKVKVGTVCGTPFRALLDDVDVTSLFSPAAPSSGVTQASFASLSSGAHTLTTSADVQHWFHCSSSAAAGRAAALASAGR